MPMHKDNQARCWLVSKINATSHEQIFFHKEKPGIQVKAQLQKFMVDVCLHLTGVTCESWHNHMYTLYKGFILWGGGAVRDRNYI